VLAWRPLLFFLTFARGCHGGVKQGQAGHEENRMSASQREIDNRNRFKTRQLIAGNQKDS